MKANKETSRLTEEGEEQSRRKKKEQQEKQTGTDKLSVLVLTTGSSGHLLCEKQFVFCRTNSKQVQAKKNRKRISKIRKKKKKKGGEKQNDVADTHSPCFGK